MDMISSLQSKAKRCADRTVAQPATDLIAQETESMVGGADRKQQRTAHADAVPRRDKSEGNYLHKVEDIEGGGKGLQGILMQDMVPVFHEVPSASLSFSESRVCRHCNKVLQQPAAFEFAFCCPGCRAVFHFIDRLGLESFYQRLGARRLRSLGSERVPAVHYAYDDIAMLHTFGSKNDGGTWSVVLYDASFDCLACEWLLQNSLRQLFPETHLSFNMTERSVTLSFKPEKNKLSAILQMMHELGYRPSLLSQKSRDATGHVSLMRLTIASFVAMNVMMLSLPEYFDSRKELTAGMAFLFNSLQAILCGISVIFVGQPFFEKAWSGIKGRRLVVDLPLALAIASIYAWSVYNFLTASRFDGLYFDSLAGLLAFLTLGRVMQERALERSRSLLERTKLDELSHFLVHRLSEDDQSLETVPLSELKIGQILRVFPGEMIPVNASLCKRDAWIDTGQISGESKIRLVAVAEGILAGSLNRSDYPIEVSVKELGVNGLLAQMGTPTKDIGRVQPSSFTQIAYRYFSLFTLSVVAGIGFFGYWQDLAILDIVTRMLAILIVACPCTFALGIPLIMSRALAKAAQQGIVVNDLLAFERLSKISKVFFDKTGTLTTGVAAVSNVKVHRQEQLSLLLPYLASVDGCSTHPVSAAIAKWAFDQVRLRKSIEDSREKIGQGITFVADEKTVYIGNSRFMKAHGIEVTAAEKGLTFLASAQGLIAAFSLSEQWAESSQWLVAKWAKQGIAAYICSGDFQQKVSEAASYLGIAADRASGDLTPDEKVGYCAGKVTYEDAYIVVGNGLNDIPFAKSAPVSVAVGQAPGQLRTTCSMELSRHDLRLLDAARQIAMAASSRIRAVTILAVAFNAIGFTLATLGFVTPVLAAIMMPLSSLTIVTAAVLW